VRHLHGTFAQPGDFVPAAVAGVEVPLVRPAILGIEGVQGVRRRQVVKFVQRNCLRA
jgi:hypothetical protein